MSRPGYFPFHLQLSNLQSWMACVFLISSVLCSGCGSDPEEQAPAPEESLRSGWEEYRAANYGAAMLAFEKALKEDGPHQADAYNGLGWVYLGFSQSAGLNLKNIAISLGKFGDAIALDENNADAWVGQAGLLAIRRGSQDDFLNALKAIDNALQGDATYLYRHDYDSSADLHALKAQCYYYLGDLDKARDEMKRVQAIEKNNNAELAMRKLLYQ